MMMNHKPTILNFERKIFVIPFCIGIIIAIYALARLGHGPFPFGLARIQKIVVGIAVAGVSWALSSPQRTTAVSSKFEHKIFTIPFFIGIIIAVYNLLQLGYGSFPFGPECIYKILAAAALAVVSWVLSSGRRVQYVGNGLRSFLQALIFNNEPGAHFSFPKVAPAVMIAAFSYALLICVMWISFAFSSGMGYETGFVFSSQSLSAWEGFFYSDPLRPNTSTFYHLAYLLSRVFGVSGSYVPYQFVYAGLWWTKGFLLFLIMRRLFPLAISLPYIVGALAIVHASDGALQWVGQMNQFGFACWLLLALYFFIAALQQSNGIRAGACLIFAGFFQYMCLWSYESPLFIILAAPIVFGFFLMGADFKRLLVISAFWYSIPAIYIFLSLQRYLHLAGTYQQSVLRSTWSLGSLLSDLGFNVFASLSFWSWKGPSNYIPEAHIAGLATVGVLVFWAAGLMFIRYKVTESKAATEQESGVGVWRLLVAGSVLLVLSFPAYLLLNSARSLWRTQLLSAIPAAMVLGAASILLFRFVPKQWFRETAALTVAAVVVFVGASTAVAQGAFHRFLWHRHQIAIQQVIRGAPQVRSDTIIVFLNVPRNDDPFGHNMWFDLGLRLAYPEVPVSGIYYYEDHTPPPGANLKLLSNRWRWDGTAFGPMVLNAGLDQTIVFEFQSNGAPRVLSNFPEFICNHVCSPELYNPGSRIIGHTPSEMAIHRYGPL